jgi:radical SAM protein
MNFEYSPLLVIWEVTQACDQQCANCRSSIVSERDSQELTTEEGFALLDQVRSFGNPLMVFTGGDVLKRPDIYELIGRSVGIGLRTNVTPSVTKLLTDDVVDRFQECGISRMAVGLDGSDAEVHDGIRGWPGSYDRVMAALGRAQRIGLETQVQTTVNRRNRLLLPQIGERVFEVGAKLWSVFFSVSAGQEEDLTGEEYEKVFETLFALSRLAPFDIRTTEGTHYRRYVAQRLKAEHMRRAHWRTAPVGDGKGFVFVSHTGEIYPSGFLRVSGGNVRSDSIVEVYRNHQLFKMLRDPQKQEGKCGRCEFHRICGGSRARAYALTGNYLAEDPRCVYQPLANKIEQTESIGVRPKINQ